MSSNYSWNTFGHISAKRLLERQLALGKLSHAYLFVGPSGIGKKTLALELAGKILATEKLQNHPDFQFLGEGGLNMEQVTGFISSLGYKPFFAPSKVAIIDNAQNLNPSSGNALLKTLEEPPAGSVLILIADRASLLPTIVSRCTVLNFNSFSQSQLAEFAEALNLPANREHLALSFGSIARLKRLISDADFFQNQQGHILAWQQVKRDSLAGRLLRVGKYAEEETENLEGILNAWLFWQTQELRTGFLEWKILPALTQSLIGLRTNRNKKLILQNLFLSI